MKKKKLFVISIMSLILSSCSARPVKPEINACIIDGPRDQIICTNEIEYRPEVQKMPVKMADKFICHSPAMWEDLQNYINELEAFALDGD